MITGRLWRTLGLLAVIFPISVQSASVALNPMADTGLKEHEPDNPQGAYATIIGGTLGAANGGTTRNRDLFKFNPVGSIPSGATITGVRLTLSVYKVADASPFNFDLRKMTVSWSEDTATWNARGGATNLWAAAGGLEGTDFSASASASLTIGSGGNTFSSTPELVADVQGWVDNPASNFGWMLLTTSEETQRSARRFYTREASVIDTNYLPVLVVDYTMVPEPGVNALLGLTMAGWLGWRIRRRLRAEPAGTGRQ